MSLRRTRSPSAFCSVKPHITRSYITGDTRSPPRTDIGTSGRSDRNKSFELDWKSPVIESSRSFRLIGTLRSRLRAQREAQPDETRQTEGPAPPVPPRGRTRRKFLTPEGGAHLGHDDEPIDNFGYSRRTPGGVYCFVHGIPRADLSIEVDGVTGRRHFDEGIIDDCVAPKRLINAV